MKLRYFLKEGTPLIHQDSKDRENAAKDTMLHNFDIDSHGEFIKCFVGILQPFEIVADQDYLTRSIGLTDKKGKDIYVGDYLNIYAELFDDHITDSIFEVVEENGSICLVFRGLLWESFGYNQLPTFTKISSSSIGGFRQTNEICIKDLYESSSQSFRGFVSNLIMKATNNVTVVGNKFEDNLEDLTLDEK